jgi:endogenous inhibitor of DNA gyrase (YacG/DUF329 family)
MDSLPFCSPRCKTIDLGKWLGGDYTVSRPLEPEDWLDADEYDPLDKKQPDE